MSKLWKHLNSIIKPKSIGNIPLSLDQLNDFFTAVFLQALLYNDKQQITIPQSAFIQASMNPNPIMLTELQCALKILLNSSAIVSDGI